MTIKALYPNIAPSLLLDFANVENLDPRITFARASTATYYNGVTTAKAEENLLLQSQDFTTTWTNVGSTDAADTQVAPDGTTTADTLTETTSNSSHDTRQTGVAVTSGLRYVWSVFAKKGDGATAPDIIQLTWASGGFGSTVFANYDISVGGGTSGTVTTTGAGAVSASITSAGNGWYRCVLVADATATTTSGMSVLFTNNNPTATRGQSYIGLITSNAFLWGAQLEQRSAVTAYTPTTTQPITNYVPVLLSAADNVARFDHNPVTGESLGLLIEEQRTNLRTYSEDFTNAVWSKSASSITADTVVAPDGALTGDKLVEDTATSRHFVSTTLTLTANTVYTLSVYMKAGERTTASLGISSVANWAGGVSVVVNLATGVITSGTGTIQSVGNGWYRVSITQTFGPANANGGMIIDLQTTAGYTGDGFSGIYIWGAQLEAGAFPTSYIPTVAAQVTRSTDAASMTGANFSSWYNQAEGAAYLEAASLATAYNGTAVAFSDGTLANRMVIRGMNTASQSATIGAVNNVAQWTGLYLSQTTAATKWAFGYKVNDVAVSRNSTTPLTDTDALLPVVNQLSIGAEGNGSVIYNGTIRKLSYYPKRLTNAELQALTQI
jgi:hypothetical protein